MALIIWCAELVTFAGEVTDEIVVTASRVPKPLKDVPGAVSIISQKDIESQNTINLNSALSAATGLGVMNYGSLGASSSVHIRGLYSQHTLVLIDDRNINDPATGSADISYLSTDNIERIEIVRGPYSALYGANAVSGVVNIITREQPDQPQVGASTLFGTYRTTVSRISNGMTYENSGYLFNSNYKTSQGNRDNSQHHSTNTTLRFSYKDKSAGFASLPLDIKIDTGYYDGESHFPGSRPALDAPKRTASQIALGNDNVSSLYDLAYDKKTFVNILASIGDLRLRLSGGNNDCQNHQEWISTNRIAKDNRYGTNSFALEAIYNLKSGNQAINGGIGLESYQYDVKTNELDTVTMVLTNARWDTKRTVYSIFAQDEITMGKTTLTLGGRIDNPTDFTSQFSGRANVLYQLTTDLNLRASYGDSYRAPSLNDLYWPQDSFAEGNRSLKPEQGGTGEVGINYNLGKLLTTRLNVFRQNLNDMIAWAPNGSMGPWGNRWTPTNLNQAKINGLELEGSATAMNNLSIRINYTLLDAEQKNQELTDAVLNTMATRSRKLAYTPSRKMDFAVSYQNVLDIPQLIFNIETQYTSKTFQYYSDYSAWPAVTTLAKQLPGYWLTNLKLRQKTKSVNFFLGIDNIANKQYAVQFGSSIDDRDYPMPGRTYTSGLELKF